MVKTIKYMFMSPLFCIPCTLRLHSRMNGY